MRKIAWILVIMLAVSMAFVACGAKDETKTDGGTAEPVASDWVKVEGYSYRLLETKIVTEYKLGGMSIADEAGQVYVWIKFAVKNDGKEKAVFSSILADAKMVMPDGKGTDAEVLADGVLNDTEFTEGKESFGEWYFKVPEDASLSVSGWKLSMKTPDLLSDVRVELTIP